MRAKPLSEAADTVLLAAARQLARAARLTKQAAGLTDSDTRRRWLTDATANVNAAHARLAGYDVRPAGLSGVPEADALARVCGAPGGVGVSCDRPTGHDGPHGDRHETWTDRRGGCNVQLGGDCAWYCVTHDYRMGGDGARMPDRCPTGEQPEPPADQPADQPEPPEPPDADTPHARVAYQSLAESRAAGAPSALCGQAIDAAVAAPCDRPAGHPGHCRSERLEQAAERQVKAFVAKVAAGQTPSEPRACSSCGTPTGYTPDWTLWPWPDGAWLCSSCNDARHEREEYR